MSAMSRDGVYPAVQRNLQLDAPAGVGLDEIDKVPRDIAAEGRAGAGLEDRSWNYTFQQAANRAPRAHIHATNSQTERFCALS